MVLFTTEHNHIFPEHAGCVAKSGWWFWPFNPRSLGPFHVLNVEHFDIIEEGFEFDIGRTVIPSEEHQ